MKPGLVLSLFPGYDLFGRAFEAQGFTVVRGPDAIWGGDVRAFHPPSGVFQGVIGGPPCQVFSNARGVKRVDIERSDMVPEFVRVVCEAAPVWWIMENVTAALRFSGAIPREAWATILTDAELGGATKRRRAFLSWPWPLPPYTKTGKRLEAIPSLLAETWKRGRDKRKALHATPYGFLEGNGLTIEAMAEAQGWPELAESLRRLGANRAIACRLLGNGVPRSMGEYCAVSIRESLEGEPEGAAPTRGIRAVDAGRASTGPALAAKGGGACWAPPLLDKEPNS